MANINPDDTTEPIESAQSSEVPQGNQKVCKACTYAGTVHTCSPGHLADTEGVKALGRKADNHIQVAASAVMRKDVKSWVVKRAAEIAKEEVQAEGKYQWEQVSDIAQLRTTADPTNYMILAIIEYLEAI